MGLALRKEWTGYVKISRKSNFSIPNTTKQLIKHFMYV
ncbi:hypothetical protein Bhyg_11640 [Pseudolycoriella hygida]|uniref:Uncharacterized protein n=1 Tax=Pseudolycoriella hygida TaxID=35572 RepID=A0A9Q0MVR6_9DIPT|nr:hypothetical protein Bhyg_11640 [Pseudolycoriella hygida]